VARIILLWLLLCSSVFSQGYFWWPKTPSTKADTSDANFIRPSDWNAPLKPFPDSSTFVSDDFGGGLTTSNSIGELGWTISASAIFGTLAGVANHPGICSLQTPVTANTTNSEMFPYGSSSFGSVMPTEFFDLTFIVKLSQTNDTTVARVGMGAPLSSFSSNNAQVNNGIWIEKDSNETSWFGELRGGAASVRTPALVAQSTNWVKFRIRRIEYGVVGTKTDDSIAFSVNDGTEVKRLATGSGIPSVALTPYVQIANNNKAVTRAILVDYFGLRTWPITR